MAARHWVGGTAAWDGTAGTKWALTAGGAGGQAVPTASDDVFFDSSSGSGTITISGTRVCGSLNTTGFTGTVAGTSTPILNLGTTTSGVLTIGSGTTWNYTGQLNIISTSTHTITTNGKTLNQLTINGSGVSATLGSALTVTNALTITQGTFDTSGSNFAVSCGTLSSSNSNTRTINLNASTITVTDNASGNGVNFTTQTGLTFTAGTSTILFTGSTTIAGNTRSFYNIKLSGNAATVTTSGAFAISNNLILDNNPTLTIASAITYAGLDTSTSTGGENVIIETTFTFLSYGQSLGTIETYISGGTVTLGDNLTAINLLCIGGALNTNNKTISLSGAFGLNSVDTTNRSLSLGSSIITAAGFAFEQINGGTSSITPSTSQMTLNGDGSQLVTDGTALTLNRLTLAATTNSSLGLIINVENSATALNLTVNDYLALTGYVTLSNSSGLATVNLTGALHLGGTPSLVILSDSATQTAFNVSSTITTGNCTLTDINALLSGTAWNFLSSGATMVDGGNNTGIIFPSGSTFTLNANNGSFALTGESATLEHGRIFNANNGSFALTGEAVTFFLGFTLNASVGNFTLTGEAATLEHGRKISVSNGSFALTGEAVSLRYFQLNAAQGSFALTGESIGLFDQMPAGLGSFAMTGEPVTMTISIAPFIPTYLNFEADLFTYYG